MKLYKIIFWTFLLICSQVQSAPVAGESINNTAYASYIDSSGQEKSITSNIVTSIVVSVYNFNLNSPQTKNINFPQKVNYQHYIENNGNIADSYNLFANVSIGTTNISNISIYPDLNQDGIADNLVPINNTPTIPIGGRFYFVVTLDVPINTGNTNREINIISKSISTGEEKNNIDILSYNEISAIKLEKSFSINSGNSPNNIEVIVKYTNVSSFVVNDFNLIDIFESNSINKPFANYLNDSINSPYNTENIQYIKNSASWSQSNLLLTDINDGEQYSLLKSINYQYDDIQKILKANINQIEPGETGYIKYSVKILENATIGDSKTNNTIASTYIVEGNKKSINSNNEKYNVTNIISPINFIIEKSTSNNNIDLQNLQNIIYKIKIKNKGLNSNSQPFIFKDKLPKGLELNSILHGPNTICNSVGDVNSSIEIVCNINETLDIYNEINDTNYKEIIISTTPNLLYFSNKDLPIILENIAFVESNEELINATLDNSSNLVSTIIGSNTTAGSIGMILNKSVNKNIAEIGDILKYTIKISNSSSQDIEDINVYDKLPYGFIYKKDTSFLNGNKINDPQLLNNSIVFNLGNYILEPNQTNSNAILEYNVIVTNTIDNNSVKLNSAQSIGKNNIISNIGVAEVEINKGILNDKSYIFGRVKTICKNNEKEVEFGLPNIKVWLSNGSFAITDNVGKYSFYNLEAKSYTIKLDDQTLPINYKIIKEKNHQLKKGNSILANLIKSDMYRADFILNCDKNITELINSKKPYISNEIENIKNTLSYENIQVKENIVISDVYSGIKNGKINNETKQLNSENNNIKVYLTEIEKEKILLLEDFLKDENQNKEKLNIYYPNNLRNVKKQENILLSYNIDSNIEVYLNDEKLKENQIGKKIIGSKHIAIEYVAVNYNSGKNNLKIILKDGFGNIRKQQELTLYSAGSVNKINLVKPNNMVANGFKIYDLILNIFDENDLKVNSRIPFTIEGNEIDFVINDLDKTQDGIQNFIENSQEILKIKSPINSGNYKFKIRIGNILSEQTVTFNSDLRPLIATGVVEGVFNFNNLKNNLQEINASDIFQDKIENFNIDNNLSFRAQFFIKGKIKGDKLLTLAYDSDKNTKEKIFRDIDPEKYYPVYGDSSTRGFDAQSSDKLFVKIEKNNNYLLYGDFSTKQSTTKNQEKELNYQISSYNRILTGLKFKKENDNKLLDTWLSYNSTKQSTDMIKAIGLSGPYKLSNQNIIINSERVELITIDKNNESLILNKEIKQRFVDYEIDYLSSSLYFKNPVSGFDSNSNPIFINVIYEIDGGENHLLYGINYQEKIDEKQKYGLTVAIDENPENNNLFTSGYYSKTINEKTNLLTEVSLTKNKENVLGSAFAISLDSIDTEDKSKLKFKVLSSEKNYDNQNSQIVSGNTEIKLNYEREIDNKLKFETDLSFTNSFDNKERTIYSIYLNNSFENDIYSKIGLKKTLDDSYKSNIDSIYIKLGQKYNNKDIYIDIEQDLYDIKTNTISIGGDYNINKDLKIYGRHEINSGLSKKYFITGNSYPTTTFGLDYNFSDNIQLYNQYKKSFTPENINENTISSGLRTKYEIANVNLTAQTEKIYSTGLNKEQNGYSFSFGTDYSLDEIRTNTRYEYKKIKIESSRLFNFGFAEKFDENYTGLIKTSMYDLDSTSPIKKHRILSGLAFRPDNNDLWNHWIKYEFIKNYENNLKTNTDAFSIHSNYLYENNFNWSNRLALKRLRQQYLAEPSNVFKGYLISGKYSYELNKNIDVSLLYSYYRDNAKQKGNGIGLELGFILDENLYLTLGYSYYLMDYENWIYNKDKNLGFYLKLKTKLDEDNYFIKKLNESEK